MNKSEAAKRLDVIVSEKFGYSREFSKELIEKGHVSVNGKTETKAGLKVLGYNEVSCKAPETLYVSRGGYKLEKALSFFGIEVSGLTCADVGASTGGFTDCLLQNGAAKVFAIDSGNGQLHNTLAADKRVVSLEGVNAKDISCELVGSAVDFVCIDVSFISVTKIVAPVKQLLKDGGKLVCLIKPQFEVGRDGVSKSGVVRDKKLHVKAIDGVINAFSSAGLSLIGLTFSPIKGTSGNVEYLALFENEASVTKGFNYSKIVEEAFLILRTCVQ